MTNPNNAVGTNGAYGGRTSVEAFNDVMNILSRGIISGWECVPNSGLTVSLGGNGNIRDVAAAEDAAGNKTSINNRSGSPINITMAAAPASNSRIDAIVAYVESSPAGSATITDNPGPCGIIPVSGTASSSPAAPNDSAIRTAITADGASGTTAFYVVLAYITIPSGTTDLTADNIAAGPRVQTGAKITADNIDFTTFDTSVVINSFLTSLQSTTSTSGVNINQLSDGTNPGNLQLTLSKTSSVLVAATFPLSTSGSNGNIDLYVDDTLVKQIMTNQESTSHSTTGFLKVDNLTAGSHKFTFKLRANAGQTAYIGSYRTISVAFVPLPA